MEQYGIPLQPVIQTGSLLQSNRNNFKTVAEKTFILKAYLAIQSHIVGKDTQGTVRISVLEAFGK